jgi:hypothetical protein
MDNCTLYLQISSGYAMYAIISKQGRWRVIEGHAAGTGDQKCIQNLRPETERGKVCETMLLK